MGRRLRTFYFYILGFFFKRVSQESASNFNVLFHASLVFVAPRLVFR